MFRKSAVLITLALLGAQGQHYRKPLARAEGRSLLQRLSPEDPTALATSGLQSSTRTLTALTGTYPFYHTSAEIREAAQALVKSCVSEASFRTESDSEVSIDVVRVKSSSEMPSNKVFIMFGEHSRELISPESGLALLRALCGADKQNAELVASVLQDNDFEMVLNGNPRSRQKVEQGEYCLRTNPSGVDLNRNWDEEWREDPQSLDSNPGPSPFSEPETRIFKQVVSDYDPTTFLTVHSGTLGMYMPWAYDTEHLAGRNQKSMMAILKELDLKHCRCPFGAAGKEVGYSCPGTSIDWVYDKLETPYSFAFEIWVDKGRVPELKDRWKTKRELNQSLIEGGSHLAHPHLADFFEKLPSDFVQLSGAADLSESDDAVECFLQYNPHTEELYKSTIDNWVQVYLEMSKKVAGRIRKGQGNNVA